MALLDILRQRTALRGGSAQVDCGALGTLTVEALSPAECSRLANNPRALLYAACRQLQQSGESLRKEGRVFRPDEITEYLSDEEVRQAAEAVLALSGSAAPAESAQEDADSSRRDPDNDSAPPRSALPAVPQAEEDTPSAARLPEDISVPVTAPGEDNSTLPGVDVPHLPLRFSASDSEYNALPTAFSVSSREHIPLEELVQRAMDDLRPALVEETAQLLCAELQRAAQVR